MIAKLLHKMEWGAWFLLIILLPITSLPLVAKLAGSSMVAAPSGVVLLFLVLFWFIPYIYRKGSLPRQVVPLLVFAAAVFVSSLAAFFLPIPLFRDRSLLRGELNALITLCVGVCMFLVASGWPRESRTLRLLMNWIDWTGLVIILWSLAQAYYWYSISDYPDWMWDIQTKFSVSGLFMFRVTGLAFEPSWLAHQLNMLYLPLWLSATVQRTTSHRFRLLGISLENVLLVGGVAVLWLSLSRVGLLSFLLMVAYLLVLANLWLVRWLGRKLFPQTKDGQSPSTRKKLARKLLPVAIGAVMLLVYAAAFLGVGYALSKNDYRMRGLFDLSRFQGKNFAEIANQLVFAERVVFWQVGWEVFGEHPLLGVGLGNVGYYFPEKMSSLGWALVETNELMYRAASIPNTKSLWVRLLSETGLTGFALFVSWLVVMWFTARSLDAVKDGTLRTLGMAGQFVVIGLFIEGFSVDTFALPYYWLTLGLMVAAWGVSRRMRAKQPSADEQKEDAGPDSEVVSG